MYLRIAASCVVALLVGCESLAEQPRTWTDISGAGRSGDALFQDHSYCSAVSQQTRMQAEAQNQTPDSVGCKSCGALNAGTIIMQQQIVDNYANAAYTNCMGSKGWRQQ